MLHKALGDDPGHHLSGVVLALATIEAQREREGAGEVVGAGGGEAIGRVGHCASVADRLEHNKNDLREDALRKHMSTESELTQIAAGVDGQGTTEEAK